MMGPPSYVRTLFTKIRSLVCPSGRNHGTSSLETPRLQAFVAERSSEGMCIRKARANYVPKLLKDVVRD